MSDKKTVDNDNNIGLSCSQRYQEFLKLDDHLEHSVSGIIDNFNQLINELKNDPDNDNKFNDNNLQNNLNLVKNMTLKHKIPFKFRRFVHHHQAPLIARVNKYIADSSCNVLSSLGAVLIIGCGPAGLRLAINLSMYGCNNITLIDSRDYWIRKQVLAIWNITESDLISLGIRDLLPTFTKSGDKKSIPIAHIQHFLLRICLLFNCKILTNIQFKSIDLNNNKINIINKNNNNKLEQQMDNIYDVLIDASGTSAVLRDCPINCDNNQTTSNITTDPDQTNDNDNDIQNDDQPDPDNNQTTSNITSDQTNDAVLNDNDIQTDPNTDLQPDNNGTTSNITPDQTNDAAVDDNDIKIDQPDNDTQTQELLIGPKAVSHKKNDIYGITANFLRVKGDHKVPQILGKAKYLFQNEFKSKKIKLENIVYYRSSLTNYLVATVQKSSLKKQLIFIDYKLKGKKLLNKMNINNDNLRKLILRVADEWNIPYNKKNNTLNAFNKLRGNKDDLALFEFGNLKRSKQPIKFVQNSVNNKYIFIGCVGDSECAPFWPKGTGVNHAFVGVYLMTFYLIKLCKNNNNKRNDINYLKEIVEESKKEFDELNSDLSDKQWHKDKITTKYINDWKCEQSLAFANQKIPYSQRPDVIAFWNKKK